MSTPAAVYKIILIGDAGVGKTTCLAKYKEKLSGEGAKSKTTTKPTIGVEFESFDFDFPYEPKGKKETKKKETIKVQIWDTAGQERYRAITKSHYRDQRGNAIYDVSDRSAFINARDVWWPELRDTSSETTGLLIQLHLWETKKILNQKKRSWGQRFCG